MAEEIQSAALSYLDEEIASATRLIDEIDANLAMHQRNRDEVAADRADLQRERDIIAEALSKIAAETTAGFSAFSAVWPWEEGENIDLAVAAWDQLSREDRDHALRAAQTYLATSARSGRKRVQAKTYLGERFFADYDDAAGREA